MVSTWLADSKSPVPRFGEGMYCSIFVAGSANADCGITFPGKTLEKGSPGVTWYPRRRDRVCARYGPFTLPVNAGESEKLPVRLASEGTATTPVSWPCLVC